MTTNNQNEVKVPEVSFSSLSAVVDWDEQSMAIEAVVKSENEEAEDQVVGIADDHIDSVHFFGVVSTVNRMLANGGGSIKIEEDGGWTFEPSSGSVTLADIESTAAQFTESEFASGSAPQIESLQSVLEKLAERKRVRMANIQSVLAKRAGRERVRAATITHAITQESTQVPAVAEATASGPTQEQLDVLRAQWSMGAESSTSLIRQKDMYIDVNRFKGGALQIVTYFTLSDGWVASIDYDADAVWAEVAIKAVVDVLDMRVNLGG